MEYKEHSTLEGSTIRKTYTTEENGTFYEVNDGGRVEFWSDKHPESRIYDENERAAAPAAPATTERVPGYGEGCIFKPEPMTWEDIDGGRGELAQDEIRDFVNEYCYADEPVDYGDDGDLANELVFFAEA